MLIVKCDPSIENDLIKILSEETKNFYLKSKNINDNQAEMIFETQINDQEILSKKISELSGVLDVSILSYSSNILDN